MFAGVMAVGIGMLPSLLIPLSAEDRMRRVRLLFADPPLAEPLSLQRFLRYRFTLEPRCSRRTRWTVKGVKAGEQCANRPLQLSGGVVWPIFRHM